MNLYLIVLAVMNTVTLIKNYHKDSKIATK